ncbi:hypothetical protein SLOPH_1703 [Spraguea lophii 42_110]|uniref:Uncharacterized protein n=1 Tax=Spraguea lophii (strain 42_110) TaxID=1358809 RepID=S7WAX4_SPRLO|nr:hypothetical protein SLOPH_1703 [Spraguea lophii 42_110]
MFLRSPFIQEPLFNIPVLDFKIQKGALILIKEDLTHNHLNLLSLVTAPVYSKDYESLKLIAAENTIDNNQDKMRIAWRYSNTPTIEENSYKTTNRTVKYYNNINDIEFTSKLIILSLNSPQNEITEKELFFLKRKAIKNNSIIFISMIRRNNLDIKSINLYFDLVLNLFNDPTKTYNSIITIEKIKEKDERINYLLSNKLGMKAKHNRIRIESIILPPEKNDNDNKKIEF